MRVFAFKFAGLVLFSFVVASCSSTERLTSVPPDRKDAPRQQVEMTARDYEFQPSVIRTKAGSILEIRIKSVDGTHGFRLGDFDIDTTVKEGEEKKIEVYLPIAGEFGFRCSHFCGLGHFGMKGKIVVEEWGGDRQ